MSKEWQIIDSLLVYKNQWIELYNDKLKIDGKKIIDYTWFKSSDVVVIVPFICEDTLVMIKQFRYPLQKILLEFPAGHIEDGEDIVQTAKRELLEETGYIANTIEYMYSYYPSVSKSKQSVHVFRAKELVKDKSNHEDTEDIEVIENVKLQDIVKMIKERKIESAGTLLAYFICCHIM